jgi:hypothetical protein
MRENENLKSKKSEDSDTASDKNARHDKLHFDNRISCEAERLTTGMRTVTCPVHPNSKAIAYTIVFPQIYIFHKII